MVLAPRVRPVTITNSSEHRGCAQPTVAHRSGETAVFIRQVTLLPAAVRWVLRDNPATIHHAYLEAVLKIAAPNVLNHVAHRRMRPRAVWPIGRPAEDLTDDLIPDC